MTTAADGYAAFNPSQWSGQGKKETYPHPGHSVRIGITAVFKSRHELPHRISYPVSVRLRIQNEFLDCHRDTVFHIACGHELAGFFNGIDGIAHRDADTGILDHR